MVFVAVNGCDTALSGAVFGVLEACFLKLVQQLMIGENDGCPVADLEVFRRDGNARLAQGLHLAPKRLEVDHRAVAEHVYHARAEDARGDQVQRELAVFVDDGVARVVAALVADDDVVFLRDKVHHAALALIAPIHAYDRAVCHS